MEDEQASIDARKHRKEKVKMIKGGKPSSFPQNQQQRAPHHTESSNQKHSSDEPHTRSDRKVPESAKEEVAARTTVPDKPESEMTPAELKRARKIARRAERRAKQESQQDE